MFAFEHAMAHRSGLGVMSPLDRFSAIPYFVEPVGDNAPARWWALNHQTAHNDAMNNLPSYYGAEAVGLRIGQNLIDWNLADERQVKMWTFINHQEHLDGGSTYLPATARMRFPFW